MKSGKFALMEMLALRHWTLTMALTLSVCPTICMSSPLPVHIQYQVEYFHELSDREFARLRELVDGYPEHPDRLKLETEHRRRTKGPDVVLHDVWLDATGIRRFNTSNTADQMFSDIAIGEDVAWALSEHQLTLLPVGGSDHPEAPKSMLLLTQVRSTLSIIDSCGRSIRDFVPVGEWVEGEPGVMIATSDDVTIQHLQRTDGTCAVTVMASESMPGIVGQRWEVSIPPESRTPPTASQRTLSEFSPSDQLIQRTTILRSQPVSANEILLLTSTPSLSGSDPVRGAYTYKAIYNFSKNRPDITVVSESGIKTIDLLQTPTNLAKSRMRMIGWFTAVVVAGIIVSLRIRSRK